MAHCVVVQRSSASPDARKCEKNEVENNVKSERIRL